MNKQEHKCNYNREVKVENYNANSKFCASCGECLESEENKTKAFDDSLRNTFNEAVKPQPTKEWKKELRYKWRGFVVVDDEFEDLGISLNADRIADWWIEKLSSLLASQKRDIIEKNAPEIEKCNKYIKGLEEKLASQKREHNEDCTREEWTRAKVIKEIFKKMDEYEYHKDQIHCTCLATLRDYLNDIINNPLLSEGE